MYVHLKFKTSKAQIMANSRPKQFQLFRFHVWGGCTHLPFPGILHPVPVSPTVLGTFHGPPTLPIDPRGLCGTSSFGAIQILSIGIFSIQKTTKTIAAWMLQEVSKWLVSGYLLGIRHISYIPIYPIFRY